MSEEFLSFIWQYKLFNAEALTVEGEKITVINPGKLNHHSGPDFFNAKILIGATCWVGNVEIHIRSSDWNRHGHDKNAAFDNVILHVALINDMSVYTSKGRNIQNVVLDYDNVYFDNYQNLLTNKKWISCAGQLKSVDSIIVSSVLSKLGIERLEQRTNLISEHLQLTSNDWEEAFYRLLARSFGFHVNSFPFESLAHSIPYILVKKYSHSLFTLEALLFGQAGFLADDFNGDDYYKKLKDEYLFIKNMHQLYPLDIHIWKFMRLRPSNFPTIRIAQFAVVLHRNPSLLSNILEAGSIKELYEQLSTCVSKYWQSHYAFYHESSFMQGTMGQESIQTIIINTIVPFFFTYGKKMGQSHLQDKALKFLEELGAERNSIIRKWNDTGIKAISAFDSQALLQLKNEYCDNKKCVSCGLGVKIISKA